MGKTLDLIAKGRTARGRHIHDQQNMRAAAAAAPAPPPDLPPFDEQSDVERHWPQPWKPFDEFKCWEVNGEHSHVEELAKG